MSKDRIVWYGLCCTVLTKIWVLWPQKRKTIYRRTACQQRAVHEINVFPTVQSCHFKVMARALEAVQSVVRFHIKKGRDIRLAPSNQQPGNPAFLSSWTVRHLSSTQCWKTITSYFNKNVKTKLGSQQPPTFHPPGQLNICFQHNIVRLLLFKSCLNNNVKQNLAPSNSAFLSSSTDRHLSWTEWRFDEKTNSKLSPFTPT